MRTAGTSMLTKTSQVLVATIAACGLTLASNADTIMLKSSVRLASGSTAVRLADIADLDGPEATALSEMTITTIKDGSAPIEIPIRDVRARLEEARINWGHISLNGRSVTVRPGSGLAGAAAAPLAMTALSLAGDETPRIDTHQRDQ